MVVYARWFFVFIFGFLSSFFSWSWRQRLTEVENVNNTKTWKTNAPVHKWNRHFISEPSLPGSECSRLVLLRCDSWSRYCDCCLVAVLAALSFPSPVIHKEIHIRASDAPTTNRQYERFTATCGRQGISGIHPRVSHYIWFASWW